MVTLDLVIKDWFAGNFIMESESRTDSDSRRPNRMFLILWTPVPRSWYWNRERGIVRQYRDRRFFLTVGSAYLSFYEKLQEVVAESSEEEGDGSEEEDDEDDQ